MENGMWVGTNPGQLSLILFTVTVTDLLAFTVLIYDILALPP